MMKYVIELKTKRYLTYPNTSRAILYDHYDPRLSFDLNLTQGKLIPVTAPIYKKIYIDDDYTNDPKEEENLFKELTEAYCDALRYQDSRDNDIV